MGHFWVTKTLTFKLGYAAGENRSVLKMSFICIEKKLGEARK